MITILGEAEGHEHSRLEPAQWALHLLHIEWVDDGRIRLWVVVYFKSALFLGQDKQELLSSSLLSSKSPNIYTLSKLLIILVPALTFF